jgi:hypothetical protein
MQLSLQQCWGCSGPADVFPALLVGLLLTVAIRAWRRVSGSNRLIVSRLDVLAGRTRSRAPVSISGQPVAEEAVRRTTSTDRNLGRIEMTFGITAA